MLLAYFDSGLLSWFFLIVNLLPVSMSSAELKERYNKLSPELKKEIKRINRERDAAMQDFNKLARAHRQTIDIEAQQKKEDIVRNNTPKSKECYIASVNITKFTAIV